MITDDDIILVDVKRRLEIEQDTTEFDIDVLSDVNSVTCSLDRDDTDAFMTVIHSNNRVEKMSYVMTGFSNI